MSTKSAHTNLPWAVYTSRAIGDPSFSTEDIMIMPKGNGRGIGSQNIAKCWDRREVNRNGRLKEDEAIANAELIVHAVNHHDELRTRLYNLVNAWDVRHPITGDNLALKEARETLKKLIQ